MLGPQLESQVAMPVDMHFLVVGQFVVIAPCLVLLPILDD